MSSGLQFDEATSRKVEALYLTPDVVAQRCQVLKALELKQGERILDIGSGPGLLAYDIAASIGREGRVCGIDISEDMLTMSRRRCETNRGLNSRGRTQLNCPIPLIVSMPLFQPRFMNTSQMFRRRSQSFIGSYVRAAALSSWTQITDHS